MREILSTADVMARYKCSRETAYKLMEEAHRFKVGKLYFAYASELAECEESRMQYPALRTIAGGKTKIPRTR